MLPPVISDPILNSPFSEPERHFRFNDEGITGQIADGRRESGYFLPIASPRKKGGQLKFETEWTQDRFLSSPRINRIRERVQQWRLGGYVGCTRTTERLLQYWNNPQRENKLFFCQREAVETAIYLTEVASHFGDAWIENELRKENADFNGGLPRMALKMATGSGCLAWRPSTGRSAFAAFTTCRRRRSSSVAAAIRKGRYSLGSFPTSR